MRLAPSPTPETEPYWAAVKRHELSLPSCTACGRAHFYPRTLCPHCGADDFHWVAASGRATLTSYIVNHRPYPVREDGAPLVIALVRLEEGPLMLTNLIGVSPETDLTLGNALTVTFDEEDGVTLPVFEVAAV